MMVNIKGLAKAVLLVVLISFVGKSLGAQEVIFTPYLGLGPEVNGLSAAAGLRVEVLGVWGGYGRAALRAVTNACETSLPPTCNYPEGDTQEYAAGITYGLLSNDVWEGRGGVGFGLLSWQDERDPFVELHGEMRRRLSQRFELVLGVHGVFAPGVERERNGLETIVPRRNVIFPNAVLGFAVQP